MDGNQANAAREVAENTPAGSAIGDPVVAEDEDGDILTYTLIGTDANDFDIDWATGQLKTKAALDKEAKDSYVVIVKATDPAGISLTDTDNSDTVEVSITITDVNEPSAIARDGDGPVTFNEVDDDVDTVLAIYTAIDPDDNAPTPTWSVGGADGSKFNIGNEAGGAPGELKFKAKPDFETPTDANTDNVYEVTVRAADGDGNIGMKAVKVTVTNQNEDGVVTLSKTRPRVGIAVTASVTDPDRSISGLTWQWGINDASGPGATLNGVIADANSDTYIPVEGDVGGTLTATASYTDGHGPGETAEASSANPVAVDTRNKPPAFVDQDTETDGIQNDMATRKVDENTEAVAADDAEEDGNEDTADNVGSVVMATDPDPNAETPAYTLGGADAAKFRVRDNGQIEVGSGTELDYETKTTYMVMLTAEDSFGSSSSIDVTIMVNDVDEAPEISEGGLAISGMTSVRYAENGVGAVATYTASGPDSVLAIWTLGGDDAGDFGISSRGELIFRSAPDFENPADADTDNTYVVTVKANDGTYMATRDVTVMVTNVDEDGMVTLSETRPAVRTPLTATLTDPDGAVTGETWLWEKSDAMTGSPWTIIPGATSANSYTPVEGDAGKYLRATASYTDGEGSGKSAMARSANSVSGLAISGMSRVDYPENDTDTVATYTASDPDAASAIWTLEGDDAGDFGISSRGELTFRSSPDYENPADADTNNTYMVTVKADDGTYTAMRNVVVTVTNVDDEPTTLLARYDTNPKNGKIDRDEVLDGIDDFFMAPIGTVVTHEEVLDLIDLFFEGLGS